MAQERSRTKHQWTQAESDVLMEVIKARFGDEAPKKWNQTHILYVVKLQEKGLHTLQTPVRDGKSCRLRYENQLNKEIYKGKMEPWEDDFIMQEIERRKRNAFSAIAKDLTLARKNLQQAGDNGRYRRTDNQVKNRWNHVLSKRVEDGATNTTKRKASSDETLETEAKRQKTASSAASPDTLQQGLWQTPGYPVQAENLCQSVSGLGYMDNQPPMSHSSKSNVTAVQAAELVPTLPTFPSASPTSAPLQNAEPTPTILTSYGSSSSEEHYAFAPYRSHARYPQQSLPQYAAQTGAFMGCGANNQPYHSYPEQPSSGQGSGSAAVYTEKNDPRVQQYDSQLSFWGTETAIRNNGQPYAATSQPQGYTGFEGSTHVPLTGQLQTAQQQCLPEPVRVASVGSTASAEDWSSWSYDFQEYLQGMSAFNKEATPTSKLQKACGLGGLKAPAYASPNPNQTGHPTAVDPDDFLTNNEASAWDAIQTVVHDPVPTETWQEHCCVDSGASTETRFNGGLRQEKTTAASSFTALLMEDQEAAQNVQNQEPGSQSADFDDVWINLDDLLN